MRRRCMNSGTSDRWKMESILDLTSRTFPYEHAGYVAGKTKVKEDYGELIPGKKYRYKVTAGGFHDFVTAMKLYDETTYTELFSFTPIYDDEIHEYTGEFACPQPHPLKHDFTQVQFVRFPNSTSWNTPHPWIYGIEIYEV